MLTKPIPQIRKTRARGPGLNACCRSAREVFRCCYRLSLVQRAALLVEVRKAVLHILRFAIRVIRLELGDDVGGTEVVVDLGRCRIQIGRHRVVRGGVGPVAMFPPTFTPMSRPNTEAKLVSVVTP